MSSVYWLLKLNKQSQIGKDKNIDVVMPVYNLVEYSDSYVKTSGSLWQYYRNKPTSTNDSVIKNFHDGDNNNASFKFQQKNNMCNSCCWYKRCWNNREECVKNVYLMIKNQKQLQ